MMNKILLSVLILSFFVACSDKKNEESNPVENEAVKVITDPLKVTLDAIVPQDDTLQIYYRFDSAMDFESMNMVSAFVKGDDSVQSIVFDLPTDPKIADFRIDFGNNQSQDEIAIKNLKLQYRANNFEAKDTLFYQYFWNNEFIDYQRDKAIAKPIMKDGKYDPIFLPREVFATTISTLYNPIATPAPQSQP